MRRNAFAWAVLLALALVAMVRAGTESASATLGTSTIDFGSSPGGVQATLVVTGVNSIRSGAIIQAQVSTRTATTDHSTDEHRVETLKITTTDIVQATGFTIQAEALLGRAYGQWTIEWEVR